MKPTPEQETILSHAANGHMMIDALAGTGKTSTIKLLEAALPKPLLYIVFNKRNKEEAEKKMESTTVVRNWNGLGHRIWGKVAKGNLTLNARKSQDILRELIRQSPRAAQEELWESYWDVIHGVEMAKALGYIPNNKWPDAKRLCDQSTLIAHLETKPDDLTLDLIDAVLNASITSAYAGSIDFNDQLYMPTLFQGTFPTFPNVAVDEFQDTNPVNYEMLRKLSKGRLICVGDPWQSIYAFRGATPAVMDQAAGEFKMLRLPLSVSFRCPSEVVKAAHWRVPHFKWSNEGGHVEKLKELDPAQIPNPATFLCRNNAPLFKLAFQLLAAGRSVSVAGSDIGPKIVGIMRKLGEDSMARPALLSEIESWRQDKLAKESKTADDIAECMKVFAEHGATLGQAIAYAEQLFKQDGSIRLMTGHKSKGLEFDTVYLLDTWLLGDDEQDLNLRYVMQTRSQNRLYEIDSNRITFNA